MILKMGTLELEKEFKTEDPSANDVITISDPEDGEINDASDLEDITDISSEEEYFLKERIKILENFNKALEKKEARRLSLITGPELVKSSIKSNVISKISSTTEDVVFIKNCENFEKSEVNVTGRANKRKRKLRPRSAVVKPHADKKAPSKIAKLTKTESSSSDSDEEKAHQRRRLRNAVRISPIVKTQKSSLKSRLFNMIKAPESLQITNKNEIIDLEKVNGFTDELKLSDEDKISSVPALPPFQKICTSDDDSEELRQLALKSKSSRNFKKNEDKKGLKNSHSDENSSKLEIAQNGIAANEDVDSDTAELRTIALKSAMLKKAMERKKRRKDEIKKQLNLRKSINATFSDDALEKAIDVSPVRNISNEPETDIEAVDMEINDDGPDSPIYENNIPTAHLMYEQIQNNMVFQQHNIPAEYEGYHYAECSPQPNDQYLYNVYYDDNFVSESPMHDNNMLDHSPRQPVSQKEEEVEVEEDEAFLRAQLLSSMSKNIKPLSSKPMNNNHDDIKKTEIQTKIKPTNADLVIKLGESDLDSECEATRNLITMHNKLKNQNEFEKNLEAYLKSARSKVEQQPPIHQEAVISSAQVKHTPMAVKHLSESDQQEYRKLIKRMAELEKVKQARQLILENSIKRSQFKQKFSVTENPEPFNGSNVLAEMSNLLHQSTINSTKELADQQIAISRQKISSQSKILESLQREEKVLQQKTDSLAAQFRAVAASFQSSRAAVLQNQHKLHTANRNLVRLRKQHQILLIRSKGHANIRGSYFSNLKFTKSTLQHDSIHNKNDILFDNNEKSQSAITRLIGSDKLIPNISKKVDLTKNVEKKLALIQTSDYIAPLQDVAKLNEDSISCLQNEQSQNIQLPFPNIVVTDSGLSVKPPELSEENVLTNNVNQEIDADDLQNIPKRENPIETSHHSGCTDNKIHISPSIIEESIHNNCKIITPEEENKIEDPHKIQDTEVAKNDVENFTKNITEPALISEDSQLLISNKNGDVIEDYKSPLQFLNNSSAPDIQAIFCPFEVGGNCKDPECKYYHPKI